MKVEKVLAIVVSYNGLKWIDKCLSSLLDSSLPVDVVVIDNGSTDGTREYIESSFTQVRLIKSEVNLFFGQGNNIGLRIALEEGYDYAFLLNQDAWVGKDTVNYLIIAHKQQPTFGILSPFHLNWEGSKVDHYFLQMVNPYDCPNFLSDTILDKQKIAYNLNFIHAACWLISRECLEEVGGFDPIFPHYGEDNDYVNRARLKGFQIGLVPSVKVFHYGFFNVSKKKKKAVRLQRVHATLELKTIQNNLLGNFIFFFKRRFDEITSLLLSRNFKETLQTLNLAFYATKIWWDLKKSRKESTKKRAFLE